MTIVAAVVDVHVTDVMEVPVGSPTRAKLPTGKVASINVSPSPSTIPSDAVFRFASVRAAGVGLIEAV